MKFFKKALSLALVLTMLATCAVSGVMTANAATPQEIVISENPKNRGVFCTNWGSQNLRFTGGNFNGVYLGAFDAAYSSADDVIYTFDNGTFANVNICSRWSQLNLSGNVFYHVNGGSFSYEHDYQFDIDNDGIENGVTQPEHAIMMGDVGGVRKTSSDSWQGDRSNLNHPGSDITVRINNLAVVIDRGNPDLVLNAVAQHNRPPHKDGVWMVIVNHCTDATAPTLTGNAGNTTTLVHGTDTENYINTAAFLQGDYRMYVKNGEANPVFDGTNLLGFTLKSNTAGFVPKITYNYFDASRNVNRKAVVYPTPDKNGIYDLSAYSYNKDNTYGYAHIVEFVPVAEALGASLRYKNDDANLNGIRFGVKFSQGYVTGAGTETANFGVILLSKALYDSKEWTLDELMVSEKARVASGSVCIWDPAAETYTVTAVLYNIAQANYTSDIIAIPYIGETLLTDAAVTRSIYDVALACVNDAGASEDARAYCRAIVDSVQNAD